MIEINENFWQEADSGKYDALVYTTNLELNSRAELVMGAGIAKAFKERYPGLPKVWALQLIQFDACEEEINDIPSRLFVTKYLPEEIYLIGLPTKIKWKNSSPIELVSKSLSNLKFFVESAGIKKVLMTRPGCGLGGLSWEKTVRPIFERLKMDDRFVVTNQTVIKKVFR